MSPAAPAPSLSSQLSARLAEVAGADPELRPATKPQFGHFQTSVALRLAKAEGVPPRTVAQRIVDRAGLDDLCEPLEIAGPGFINIRLKPSALAEAVTAQLADSRHGVVTEREPQTVVIDYSSPNVAKQMHVGHLRSTIIGDCFNRVLAAEGDRVIPQNHIGDWGTQFGMLVERILAEGVDAASLDLPAAEQLYTRAAAQFRDDVEFAAAARARVVALQAGDPQTRAVWQALIDVSTTGFNAAYDRLGVLLTDDDLAGESVYNEDLPVIAADLEARGVAVIDDGALCVFVDGFAAPMIIRKRDGGYGYAATDLAAVRRRVGQLRAERIVYITDVRQHDHFLQVFAVARKAGYLPAEVTTEHVGFGMVLGTDGKPFKTREGKAMHLSTLLDMAQEKAAPPIALAALKYADLSNGLNKDYVFDLDRMLQTTGNTGPYLQYAHARLTQLLRRAEADGLSVPDRVVELDSTAEQALALILIRYGETVQTVASTLEPHRLCSYLYELSGALSVFYEQCPVLKSEGSVRDSRLALCAATKAVLAAGLGLLGIDALERM